MLKKKMSWWVKTAILVLSVISLGACVEYEIETTLNDDGSGVRVERIEAMEDGDFDISADDFVDLMDLKPARGWSSSTEFDDDGDTVYVFERRTEVGDLNSWSDLSDHVRIHGSVPARAGAEVGYVSLATIQFRNSVRVETGRVSDGSASFTYRESFQWDNVIDALVETYVQDFGRTLARRYPEMGARDLGEVMGFARARLWDALDEGLLDAEGDWQEELLATVVDRTTEHALRVVRVSYPEAEEGPIRRELEDLFEDDSVTMQVFLDELVPGLTLSLNTSIIFRLNMPGRVTDSNAHETDGNTLVWEFSPSDAIQAPIEIYAESARSPDRQHT